MWEALYRLIMLEMMVEILKEFMMEWKLNSRILPRIQNLYASVQDLKDYIEG